ncbi:hypothetical protein A9Q81_02635 [Gammaproteobacteria bacterium 42_54_T18]|nr:hypothetical protein A9Q81_02635 [Gammaproteobacteria bacterium 42_54_T18]
MGNNDELKGELLAASIHEIKNRLGLMFGELDDVLSAVNLSKDQQQQVQRIKSESQFVSNELVRVLASYKSLGDDFYANVDQHFAIEFLEEVIARHSYTVAAHNLHFTLDCNEDVSGFFDNSILFIILDTCIYNSIKAGALNIKLSATEDEQFLYLVIDDNGPGFPEELLEGDFSQGSISVESQSTGLGLFFANKLIQSHKEADLTGSIQLSNIMGEGNKISGAKVTLSIPL